MRRTLERRFEKLTQRAEDGRPAAPWLVLFPGQEPPEGHTGPVVRVQVIDGRKS